MLRDIVVIGGSAGGLKALQQLVAYLPEDLPATVLVSTHLAPTGPSRVAAVLDKAGRLPARDAQDGERLVPGTVRVAVPDRHLVLDDGDVLRLSRGPRENRSRPSVDALFRSAARWAGARVIGVVLSGSLDDGAAGLAAIAEHGGVALVQDPGEALFDGMPRAALRVTEGATALPAGQLARRIIELAGREVQPAGEPDETLIWETDMVRDVRSERAQGGTPVGLGCPDCGGGMKAVPAGLSVHYICHTGHSFSPESFLAARQEGVEAALWTALSAMQEKAMVLRELAGQAGRAGDDTLRKHHENAGAEVEHAAEVLRRQVIGGDLGVFSDGSPPSGPR